MDQRVITRVSRSTVILEIYIFVTFFMANGRALPTQIVCCTKPYKNYSFQIDGASWYFYDSGNWCSYSFQCCVWPSFIGAVISMIKVYCHWRQAQHYNIHTMYQRKANVDMLNAVKGVLADVLSVSPSLEQRPIYTLLPPTPFTNNVLFCSETWNVSFLYCLEFL